jgi:hypothetical protein
MSYCNNCGVELDTDMSYCPLCGSPAGQKKAAAQKPKSNLPFYKDKILSEIDNLTATQKRKLFWEISSIILISSIIITLIINFIINKEITWAKYYLLVSLSVFSNISFFSLWRNRPYLLVIGSFISTAVPILLIDLISAGIGWGTKLGMPLLVSLYTLLIVVVWIIRISHQKGFNILAMVFLAVSIYLICIEVFVSLYHKGTVKLSWSIISGSSMIPISVMLFYVHYRLKSGIELKRFFHI